MTQEEYKEAELLLTLKYGSISKAIDEWVNVEDEDECGHVDGFDLLEEFLAQPRPRDESKFRRD